MIHHSGQTYLYLPSLNQFTKLFKIIIIRAKFVVFKEAQRCEKIEYTIIYLSLAIYDSIICKKEITSKMCVKHIILPEIFLFLRICIRWRINLDSQISSDYFYF